MANYTTEQRAEIADELTRIAGAAQLGAAQILGTADPRGQVQGQITFVRARLRVVERMLRAADPEAPDAG